MNVVSFGGGTNSTAMIIGMYLHKIPIDLILFADTGGDQRAGHIGQGKRKDVSRRRSLYRRSISRQQRTGGA